MSTGGGVLLTGATGFLGRALLERSEGLDLIAVARTTPAWARDLAGVKWIEADLSRPGFERELPERLDSILHLARSRRQREFPEGALDLYEVNVGATARLLDHARRSGAGRFVLASTASVYRRSAEPLSDDAPLECSSPYAASKRSAELLLGSYADHLAGIALRLFTPYGPGQRGQLIADLIGRVRAGEAIEVEGRRGLLLSPIHVTEIVEALLAALRAQLPGGGGVEALNVGGAEALGIREIGEAIGDAVGLEPRFRSTGEVEPGGYVADRTRAVELLGLPDPIPFREGIRRTVEAEAPAAG